MGRLTHSSVGSPSSPWSGLTREGQVAAVSAHPVRSVSRDGSGRRVAPPACVPARRAIIRQTGVVPTDAGHLRSSPLIPPHLHPRVFSCPPLSATSPLWMTNVYSRLRKARVILNPRSPRRCNTVHIRIKEAPSMGKTAGCGARHTTRPPLEITRGLQAASWQAPLRSPGGEPMRALFERHCGEADFAAAGPLTPGAGRSHARASRGEDGSHENT